LGLGLDGVDGGWRILFGVPAVLAVLQSAGMLLLPESPQWLAQTKCDLPAADGAVQLICANQDNDQYSLLDRIFKAALASDDHKRTSADSNLVVANPLSVNSEKEQLEIMTRAFDDRVPSTVSSDGGAGDTMLQYLYPLCIIAWIQLLIQFTGGVVIRNYAPIIFEDSGFSSTAALLINVLLGLLKLFISLFSAGYMEKCGRIQLLLYSTYVVGAGMLIGTIGFWTHTFSNRPHETSYETAQSSLFLIGCFLVIGGYSFGFGSVPWVLSAEMFPTSVRGWAMSVSLIASNIGQGITNFGFLPLTEITSPQTVFGIFFVMNIVTWAFIRVYAVETRDLPPAVILQDLRQTAGMGCINGLCPASGSHRRDSEIHISQLSSNNNAHERSI
jgi:hypothetical protein